MKITPLAADSFGARSMATIVETPDVSVLIDPSVRLGPFRYDLRPHPTEKARQKELWQAIRTAIDQRRWDVARSMLEAWVERQPGDGKAWLNLGSVLGMLGRSKEAEEA